jgi:hypothetical protein
MAAYYLFWPARLGGYGCNVRGLTQAWLPWPSLRLLVSIFDEPFACVQGLSPVELPAKGSLCHGSRRVQAISNQGFATTAVPAATSKATLASALDRHATCHAGVAMSTIQLPTTVRLVSLKSNHHKHVTSNQLLLAQRRARTMPVIARPRHVMVHGVPCGCATSLRGLVWLDEGCIPT